MIRFFYYLIIFLISMSVSARDYVNVSYQFNDKLTLINSIKTPNGYAFNLDSDKELVLTTLDWPPYIGEQLCNKGWVFQLAVSLFVHAGYQVEVRFMPWARAVREVELGHSDILFPEYFIENSAPSDNVPKRYRNELLALSDTFPGGEIGFLKRVGSANIFNGDLASIKGRTIGVVRGYQNTPEFDLMMDNNVFHVVEAVDDLQLVRLLIAKRVELIIGDIKALKYAINYADLSNIEKQQMLNAIEVVSPSIQYNSLYFAVSKKKTHWQRVITEVNQALAQFKQSGEVERIKELANTQCI